MMMAAEVPTPEPPYAHLTVMRDEVVRQLSPRSDGVYLDVTAGGGGHSEAILEANGSAAVLAFDRDSAAVAESTRRLAPHGGRALVTKATFAEVADRLRELGVTEVDGLVADLGLSSAQLSSPSRGMSFRAEGPLDMRMDAQSGETALELVQRLSQEDLADLIYQLGEERRSRRIASCIKQALDADELRTTLDLRRAVVRAVGPRRVGGIDPATRTFQALRMAVNQELAQLETLLEVAPGLLKPGGTAVLISFHSLEDRLVKRAFLQGQIWSRLTRKPISATSEEQTNNPRSRSAKLRVATKI